MAKYQVLKTKVTVNPAGLKVVKPPSIDFKIEVEINNKIFKEAKLDPLLRMKFADQAKDILVQTQKTVFDKCKSFDKLLQGMLDHGEDIKVVQKNLDGLNQALQQDYKVAIIAAEMGVKKVWDEVIAKRKTWKKFKSKTAVSIVGAIVAIPAAAIAGLVLAPFTAGASSVATILVTTKSCVTIAGNIKKIVIGRDNANKELRREWEKEVKIRLNKHPTSKKSDQQKKIMNQFDSNTKSAKAKISSCSAKCLSMYEKNTKMTKALKELAQRVEELKIKDSKGLKAFRKALKYCNKAFSTLAGDTIKSGAVALAEDIGSAGASYVYDTLASKALKGTVLDPA